MAVSDITGFLETALGRTWYRVVGDLKAGRPLVVLHGGPGYPSYYLENLASLADGNRAIVFYDQISTGRSFGPSDSSQWTIENFVSEFVALLDHLDIAQAEILGHSWGGFLALEIVLRHPELVSRLILSSTASSSDKFLEGAKACLATMSPEHQSAINNAELNGEYSSPKFQAAQDTFMSDFCNRLSPLPESVKIADREMNNELYNYMWGPSEFRCTGTLRDWDVSDRLGEIEVPVLLTSGQFDEAGPLVQNHFLSALRDASWVELENGAHMAHLSNETEFVAAVAEFLNE